MSHLIKPAFTRREFLSRSANGFGYLAFAGLSASLAREAQAATVNPLAPKSPHHRPRAKRIIFLFMHGAPSQVDTFDPKPLLVRDNGKPFPHAMPAQLFDPNGKLLASPWEFKPYGQSGIQVSTLFPEVGQHVDDLCMIRSMHTDGQAHGLSVLKLHTGQINLVRPSMGSWLLYGLGTENQNLPGYITFAPPAIHGGAQNYGSAFLPAVYQGTPVGEARQPASEARISYLQNPEITPKEQRRELTLLQEENHDYLQQLEEDSQVDAVIQSHELAFRMQMNAPNVMDIEKESKATQALYGIGEEPTDHYGRLCLMARRCSEAGVRFVQVNTGYTWDQHQNLKADHEKNARKVDKPIAGLLTDLKARGLLKDTLVLWGAEFGRTPTAQGTDGRDHDPHGFTVWLAGGGVKGGHVYGSTDEYGFYAVENKVHMHDLHATILDLLGLDHTRLTYNYGGRNFRLTDVYGNVVRDIYA